MYQGTLPPRSNKAGWSLVVEVLDDDTDEAVDISDCTIVFELRDPRMITTALSATTDNGKITIGATGFFTVAFTGDDMKTLIAETYEVGCTITNNDSEPQQLIIGTVPILDGVVTQ
jgi:hypothetical protein